MKAWLLALLLLASPAMAQQVPNPMPITGGPNVTPRFGYLHVERPATAAGNLTDMYIYRDANYTGGTHGTVNTLASFGTKVTAGALPHEWNLYATIDNYGTIGDGSENVALYVAGVKRTTGFTWGTVSQVTDYNNTVTPTKGAIALELNLTAAPGADLGNNRIALEIFNNAINQELVATNMRADISLDGVFSVRQYGLEVNGFGSNYWGRIVGLSNNARYGYGIDLTGGTCDFAQFNSPAFQVDCAGSVSLGVATPQGAGTINAQNGYWSADQPGVNCAAGVTAATVRVVKGIVTAC